MCTSITRINVFNTPLLLYNTDKIFKLLPEEDAE